MGMIERKSFPKGWTPDVDPVDAPRDCLLRADNTILDELGILALRPGQARINSFPLEDRDIHSLWTSNLYGIRYRMWGAGNHVYSNQSDIGVEFASSGDIHFGSHMGQIFMARSTTKKKWDGSTVRNWGIAMTGTAPTVLAINGPELVIVSGDIDEDPPLVWESDDGTGPGYEAARDGTPNGSARLFPSADPPGGAVVSKTWPTEQDFSQIAGIPLDENSVLHMNTWMMDTQLTMIVRVEFSVDGPNFTDVITSDWYGPEAVGPPPLSDYGFFSADNWWSLMRRQGEFYRYGTHTPGKGMHTVHAVRISTYMLLGAAQSAEIRVDELRFIGTVRVPLTGKYEWAYMYARDDGNYVARSAHMITESPLDLAAQSAQITIPADPNRDPQVNEIWVFRRGGLLDGFYRVATQSITEGDTGAIVVNDDALSDADALILNIKMEMDNILPPDDIVGIEGPYYDRFFALTVSHLYPSRRLSPDTFGEGLIIRVAGPDERAMWVKKAHGGLYIGTTKDIYRLEGTGAELPDGTVEFTFAPLNIDNPPVNEAVAQEGSLLIYLAADGWRAFSGAGSQSIVGSTSLLYQDKERHGVLPVNIRTGRFRAAIAKGQLVAITPEGSITSASTVLYRFVSVKGWWYRHVYPLIERRAIHREPDGTLVASDNDGIVWVLDSGTRDGDAAIPVEIWTTRDDDGNGFAPKVGANLSVNVDTNGEPVDIYLHADEDERIVHYAQGATTQLAPLAFDVSDVDIWRQIQLKLKGSFTRFRLSGFFLSYHGLPSGVKVWDSGPMNLGVPDLVWVRRVELKVRASADLTVTMFFDDHQFTALTIPVVDGQRQLGALVENRTTILDLPVPRGYFGRSPRLKVHSTGDFHPYFTRISLRRTKAASEKPEVIVPSGLGGEMNA